MQAEKGKFLLISDNDLKKPQTSEQDLEAKQRNGCVKGFFELEKQEEKECGNELFTDDVKPVFNFKVYEEIGTTNHRLIEFEQ